MVEILHLNHFKDGVVTVELKGSCSGCPSSVMTLKQGVQNLTVSLYFMK